MQPCDSAVCLFSKCKLSLPVWLSVLLHVVSWVLWGFQWNPDPWFSGAGPVPEPVQTGSTKRVFMVWDSFHFYFWEPGTWTWADPSTPAGGAETPTASVSRGLSLKTWRRLKSFRKSQLFLRKVCGKIELYIDFCKNLNFLTQNYKKLSCFVFIYKIMTWFFYFNSSFCCKMTNFALWWLFNLKLFFCCKTSTFTRLKLLNLKSCFYVQKCFLVKLQL